jgi:hypothetical protein
VQLVPVPSVQVIVVAPPFLSTVTTPDDAFTPPVPAFTINALSVPAFRITMPAPMVVLVQVVSVTLGPVL